MADGFRIASGYVEVSIDDQTGPGKRALLTELRKLSPVKVRTIIDDQGVVRTLRDHGRYSKHAAQSGTFIGEVMGRNWARSMAKATKHPYLLGPLRTGMVAGLTSAASLAGGAATVALAAAIQANNAPVAAAVGGLSRTIVDGLREDTGGLVPHFEVVADRLGAAFERQRPRMQNMFGAVVPQMHTLTTGVLRLADNAMPGLERSVLRAGPAVDGLADGLGEAGHGVTRFFTAITRDSTDAGTTLRAFGMIVSDAGELVGTVLSEVTSVFAGVSDEATDVFDSLTGIVVGFSQNALPILGVGLEVTTAMFGAVLDVLEPFSGVLGTAMGTVLAGTIIVRGLSGSIGILTSAFTLLSGASLKASMATFATQMGNTALAAGTLTTTLTGSAVAGDKVAATGARVTAALGRVANTLPFVGALVVGGILLYEEYARQTDAVARANVTAGMSLDQLGQKMAEQHTLSRLMAAGTLELGVLNDAFAQDLAAVTAELDRQYAALTPLEQAQVDVARALAIYNTAVLEHGPASSAAQVAAGVLATARREEENATLAAKLATRGHTQALVDNQMQIMAMANADLAHRMAMHERTQAQKDLTAAVREHGRGSDEAKEAAFRLEGAEIRVAEAAGRLASENRGLTTDTERATAAADAERASIINMASAADGRASPSILNMARQMSNSAVEAHNAAVETSGFDYKVRNLPDGRRVFIAVDHEGHEITDIGNRMAGLRDRVVRVHADGTYSIAGTGQKFMATGGILPGYTPGRDVHTFTSPTGGKLGLSGGEAIMRPEWTRAMGSDWIHGANKAAAAGGVAGVQRYLTQGSGPGQEGRRGDSAAYFAAGGIYPFSPQIVPDVHADIQQAIMVKQAALIKKYFAQGGNALAWARTQVGKPYIWASSGPRGYDCSGFMSAVANVLQGKYPHTRRGATGSFPWAGFRPGWGPGLTIGSFRGNPGHMAGTIAGTNVESSGGVGVRVGGPVGAGHGMFSTRAHLPFDDGGLVHGKGLLPKLTAEPERVLSPRQTEAFERLVELLDRQTGTTGVGGQTVNVNVAQTSGSPAETGRFVALALRTVG